MSVQIAIKLINVFLAVLSALYLFIIFGKIRQTRRAKRQQHIQTIKPVLENILTTPEYDYSGSMRACLTGFRKNMKSKIYCDALESVLLEYLEEPSQQRRRRALSASYDLGLPSLCLSQIASRNSRNIIIGCRNAGLYKYKEAAPSMLDALSAYSGKTQFQILMGLSRIGNVDIMCQAFNTVSKNVLVNERAACEILETFSGDKYTLYKHMLYCEEEYIAAIFLKSIEQDLAVALVNDITDIMISGGKELRIAAIKAIGKMDKHAPAEQVIKALNDNDWEVRAIAAKTLGALAVPDAGEALALSLQDSEWWVRQNAASALLSNPNYEELFLNAVNANDAYALDSIVYVLENAQKTDILKKIQQIRAKPKGGNI